MPTAKDITGLRFGLLTAVKLVENTSPRRWLFACKCGVVVDRRQGQVTSGKTSSCGCFRKATTAKARFIDRTGRRYGRLLVVEQVPGRDRHLHIHWKCLCDCGNTTTTATPGKTKSCGCIHREAIAALGASSKQENPVSRTKEYRKALVARLRSNPAKAMHERIARMLAMSLQKVGAVKSGRTFDMLGFTPGQLKSHMEKQFTHGMSWENRAEWQIDHIVPISTAVTADDVLALNQLSNLRPMWSKDNNEKRAKRETLL